MQFIYLHENFLTLLGCYSTKKTIQSFIQLLSDLILYYFTKYCSNKYLILLKILSLKNLIFFIK